MDTLIKLWTSPRVGHSWDHLSDDIAAEEGFQERREGLGVGEQGR